MPRALRSMRRQAARATNGSHAAPATAPQRMVGRGDGRCDNVTITRDPNERRQCGFARIGANPGSITLINDVCSCGSNKIPGALVAHEVGHALGFFHVDDRRSVMYPFFPGNCPAGTLSAAEAYHAGIAYSRPRGNLDPDRHPSTGSQLMPGSEPWSYR